MKCCRCGLTSAEWDQPFPSKETFLPGCVTLPSSLLNSTEFLPSPSERQPESQAHPLPAPFPQFGATCKLHEQRLADFHFTHNIKLGTPYDGQLGLPLVTSLKLQPISHLQIQPSHQASTHLAAHPPRSPSHSAKDLAESNTSIWFYYAQEQYIHLTNNNKKMTYKCLRNERNMDKKEEVPKHALRTPNFFSEWALLLSFVLVIVWIPKVRRQVSPQNSQTILEVKSTATNCKNLTN